MHYNFRSSAKLVNFKQFNPSECFIKKEKRKEGRIYIYIYTYITEKSRSEIRDKVQPTNEIYGDKSLENCRK